MEDNGTNGDINTDSDQSPLSVKESSIQPLSTSRKVIQLKIDNPLLTNGDVDDDVDDPFCIKPSVIKPQENSSRPQDLQNDEPKQNGPSKSKEADEVSSVSDEKSLPNGEIASQLTSEIKNNDSDKSSSRSDEIMEDISSEMKEIEGSEKSSKEERLDHSTEKIEEDLDKSKDSEQSSVNEDPEHSKIASKLDLDVESVKYFMSTDSKDSTDDGTALSRSDKVDLNESVISVSEDNSSVVESNTSEVVPELICSSGEEEQSGGDLKKSDGIISEHKVDIADKVDESKDSERAEVAMEVDSHDGKKECSVKDDSKEKANSDEKIDSDGKIFEMKKFDKLKENEKVMCQNKNEHSVDGSTKKEEEDASETVGKVKDIDGSDILITINEDSDKDEESSSQVGTIDIPISSVQQMPRVTSTVKDDVVIVDLSDDKPPPPVKPKPPVVPIKPGMVTVGPNGQHYVQHVIHCLDGRKQIIQVPVTSSQNMGPTKVSGVYTSLLNRAIASSVSHSQTTQKQRSPEEYIHPDDLIPQSSMEMIALAKYDAVHKNFDNTFWSGSCPVKGDISTMTKVLQDLGGDIVKQSAYSQIVEVQGRKAEQGKLGDKEKENLERMKKVVKELKEKYKHLELNYTKCAGCNFVTESKNVMAFHKEHPHMDPPLDPYGFLKCPQDGCDFKSTAIPEVYAQHMDEEHSVKARIYDKPDPFKCHLCFFETKAKSNLTRHRFKCDKQFKLGHNLHPSYADINFCLKNAMYKSQIAAKSRNNQVLTAARQPAQPPMIRPKIAITKPTAPLLPQGPRNSQVPVMIPLSQAQMSQLKMPKVRPGMTPVLVPMGPVNQSVAMKPHVPTVGEMLRQQKQQQVVVNRPVAPKPSAPSGQQAGFEVCEICGGYVKDRMSLQIHFFYAHKVDLPAVLFQKNSPQFRCNVCQAPFWTAMGLTKHRQSSRHFDTVIQSAKPEIRCWICFQQPDNLYSHLQSFHKLNPNECMILRRCMFCAIQTRTRKDLELHMATTHGILIKGTPSSVATSSSQPTKPPAARSNFCVFCSKQFPDNTQLTLHCLRDHATCSGCGMVVARAADLVKHACKSTGRKCPICGLKNLKQAFYNKHIHTHLKKCYVKVKRLSEKEIEKAMGKERKAKMDLEKQREIFTKLESEIWDEIQNRKKRDDGDSTNTKKRRSNDSDKSTSKKAKLETDSQNVVVLE